MRTALLSIAFVLVFHTGVAAQPVIATSPGKDAQARALYFSARAKASAGDHRAAVRLIDRAITLLGARKRRLMPLLIDSLQRIHDYRRAVTEAATYLAMKPVIKSRAHNRIAALLPELKRQAVAHKRKQERLKRQSDQKTRRADDAAWKRATKSNNSYSYRYYVQQFPRGRHIAEARTRLGQAKQREDNLQLEQQRLREIQRRKHERLRRENRLRYKIAREMQDRAKSLKSSSSLYYTGGILALIGGGAAAVLLEDSTPRVVGAVGVVAGGVLLYLAQSRVNRAAELKRDAEDIRLRRKPLPPGSGLVVSPWVGPKHSYGVALGGRF